MKVKLLLPILLLITTFALNPAKATSLTAVNTTNYTFYYPSNFSDSSDGSGDLTYLSPTNPVINSVRFHSQTHDSSGQCTTQFFQSQSPSATINSVQQFTQNGFSGCYIKMTQDSNGTIIILEGRAVIKNNQDFSSVILYQDTTPASEIQDMQSALNAFVVKANPTTSTPTTASTTLPTATIKPTSTTKITTTPTVTTIITRTTTVSTTPTEGTAATVSPTITPTLSPTPTETLGEAMTTGTNRTVIILLIILSLVVAAITGYYYWWLAKKKKK
jgi:hypothetical protein